jgi:2-C-methyl-D-erythritol 2,4-cyclodiphosphate synthase
MLGGVRIPFDKGAMGHSDGDALVHALCDALLGAAGLGDIGRHFPDSSPRWRNASSLSFLLQVREMLQKAGFRIVNVDATIGLERPKLAPYMPSIIERVARTLKIQPSQVSVKAKTGEGMGPVGRGEIVRADAIALIESSGAGSRT